MLVTLRDRELELATQEYAKRCDKFTVETNGLLHRHISGVCIVPHVEVSSNKIALQGKYL